MAIYIRRLTWIDVNGSNRTTQVLGNATLATVDTAIHTLTNADDVLESEAQLFANMAPTPVNALYNAVQDEADLWFLTTASTIVQITVVAPISSLFMADQETVDPTSVAGLLATAIGLVVDPAGNAVVSFVGGRRSRQGR